MDDFFGTRSAEIQALVAALIDRRERAVLLIGAPGMGKTTLVNRFALAHHGAFPGGITTTSGRLFDPAFLPDLAEAAGPGLHIFDGLDEVPPPYEPVYAALLDNVMRHPRAQLLITTRTGIGPASLPHVDLKPMNFLETATLLRQITLLEGAPPDEIVQYAEGNPALAGALAELARERGGYRNVLADLRPFRQAGLVGPDGAPLAAGSGAGRRIVTHVGDVNRELLAVLQADPERVYELTPRRFEEVTATLFEQLGYTVTLTPASKDGGKDLYIARTDALGSFLYYVECKRYAPDRPVGVGLVNALTGVLASDRATAALMLTTSRFTAGARDVQQQWQYRLSLKDFGDFRQMLADAGRLSG